MTDAGLSVPGMVPLREWRVKNFKSIKDAELRFAPLTVLVGANSSGKTSLLQSILLAAQAAQAENEGATFPLNGSLASVGAFNEVRFAHAKGGSVCLGGRFELPTDLPPSLAARTRQTLPSGRFRAPGMIDWSIELDAPAVNEPGSAEIAAVEARVRQPAPDQEVAFSATRRGQGVIEADVERFRLGSLVSPSREAFSLGFTGALSTADVGQLSLHGILLRAGLPHGLLTRWRLGDAAATVWVLSRVFRPFWAASEGPALPPRPTAHPDASSDSIVRSYADDAVEEIRSWNMLRQHEPVTLPAFLAGERKQLDPDVRRSLQERADELAEAIREELRADLDEDILLPPKPPLGGFLNEVMSDLHRFLRQRVVYLGPLRQDPQVVYKTAPVGAAGFIGTRGEYLPAVLHASRAREVLCPREDGTLEPMRLADALNAWISALGLADEVQTRDLGRLGIQVSVTRGGVPPVDLTSVGVGVSQVLPVVVSCLLAEPGSLVLLEQPELHLHPAAQQRLGDFLLACARSGRQLIVETHSEYVLSRLRRRVAEDESVLGALAVYFGEQRDDVSEFRHVEVNEFGGIEEWPVGFFDQAAVESRRILEVALEKRDRRGREAETPVSS